jgi:hypothetical protein
MTDNERERIAVLETQHDQLLKELRDMRKDVSDIKRQVTSWRGIVLGIVLTVSAVWSSCLAIWNAIKHKFAG